MEINPQSGEQWLAQEEAIARGELVIAPDPNWKYNAEDIQWQRDLKAARDRLAKLDQMGLPF